MRIPNYLKKRIESLKLDESEPMWRVIERALDELHQKKCGKKSETQNKKNKTDSSHTEGSELWEVWRDAYSQRYGVEYPRNAKNNALIKKLVERIGYDNAKKVLSFYVKSMDPWLVSRQHPLEVLVKDAESWVTREANNQLLISRSKLSAYDSSVSWAEVASKVANEIGGKYE